MKANIAKRVLLCALTAALLVAPAMGVSASSSGSKGSSKVEEIISSNGGQSNTGGSGSSSVASVPTTGLSTISTGYGLANGERPYARIYNMDAKKSYQAQACIDNAAASMGAVAGPAINVEIGKMASGKFSLLPADGAAISLKVGIPKNFAQSDKTFAVVAVRPGGAVSILQDTDTNPDTVTFDTTAGQAVYALIKY